jgi:excisionase family DNA binding protein
MEELTSKEAAERLGVTPARVRKLCIDGLLPGAKKFGRDWFVPESAINAYSAVRRPRGNPNFGNRDYDGS